MTKERKASKGTRVVIRTLTSEPKHADAGPRDKAMGSVINSCSACENPCDGTDHKQEPKLKQDNAAERPKVPHGALRNSTNSRLTSAAERPKAPAK